MSTYIDYCVDHDLDTSSIKNMILDLESRLGYKQNSLKTTSNFLNLPFFLIFLIFGLKKKNTAFRQDLDGLPF